MTEVFYFNLDFYLHYTYRVIQEESAILWETIVCVILSKKVHMNMVPILNNYRDMVKRRYGPSCEHEQ
jgi:amino acid permease